MAVAVDAETEVIEARAAVNSVVAVAEETLVPVVIEPHAAIDLLEDEASPVRPPSSLPSLIARPSLPLAESKSLDSEEIPESATEHSRVCRCGYQLSVPSCSIEIYEQMVSS